ncbi:MAG: hypothetical protein LBV13_03500 [Methanomassiliicoccaceae archaeon]|nr:hypothetical protein [Methanomassiliicoccaceae archaeon]
MVTMLCKQKKNNCICKNTDCPRHGKCCDCVAFHRDTKGDLPVCLRKE